MGEQKVAPIAEWDEAESQIEAWAVFFTLFLGDNKVNPAAYKMLIILEDTSVVRPRMQAQARQKTTIPPPSFVSYRRSSMRASARRWRGGSR